MPDARFELDQSAELSCHTNHFKRDRSDSWCWNKKDTSESKKRLKKLDNLAKKYRRGANGGLRNNDLREALEELRVRSRLGLKNYTAATIIFAVNQFGTKVEAYDHFDAKDSVRVGTRVVRVVR
jgi:hypothetical protein